MSRFWLELADIPAEGREFSFTDQALWEESFRDFAMPFKVAKPLTAEVLVLPEARGALVRGRLTGALLAACGRCAEAFELPVDESFEEFEELPAEGQESAEDARVAEEGGTLRLDLGAVLWERLVLALPARPLCDESCKGLCPKCGGNRNFQECACGDDDGDARLAALRKLKIS